MPRRLGTTVSKRPLAASTRHASRKSPRTCSLVSNACTMTMRSKLASSNGSSSSSVRHTRPGALVGQCKTPWLAGIAATTRSALSRKGRR